MAKPRFKFDAFTDFAKERQIAQAEMKRYASSGSLVAFEPTLHGSTTNPDYYKSVGAHSVPAAEALRAAYVRHDDNFSMWFSFNPSVSFTAGSGFWTMDLPDGITISDTAAGMLYAVLGTWSAYDSDTGNRCTGIIRAATTTSVRFLYQAAAPVGASTSLGAAAPWAWAALDQWGGYISLPIM